MPTPGPAGIFSWGVLDEHQRDVEHLLDGADADHADLLQDGVEHAVLADERAGMRWRGPRARALLAPALISTTGLLARRASSSARTSLPPFADAFEVGGDDPRALVLGEGRGGSRRS